MPLNPIQQNTTVTPVIQVTKADSSAKSIFSGHTLAPQHPKPLLHFTNYDYLIASVMLLVYAIFVMLYVKNRKRLNQIIKAFYVNRYASQLAREEVSVVNRVSVLLSVIFLFSITVFTWQVIAYYGWVENMEETLLFFSILLAYILIYTIKFIAIKFMGFVFKTSKDSDEYVLTVLLFLNTLGLFLLPVVVCIAFAQNVSTELLIKMGLYIVGSFLLVRIIRGVIIGINSIRVSKFYLFLYLCTLEILPLIVMIKIVVKAIK